MYLYLMEREVLRCVALCRIPLDLLTRRGWSDFLMREFQTGSVLAWLFTQDDSYSSEGDYIVHS
ncbi:hypothetical protein AMD24_00045 [Candidatus Xiphinematobacter sp. Idaho Grape]|nr:hypothetical protein AMD24_00045 [Candidatus Xiphinematobacter sp. Idaho Grape]